MRTIAGPKVVVEVDISKALPAGAEWRGEFFTWKGAEQKVLYEREEISRKVAVIDPLTDKPMYKRGGNGQTLGTMHTKREVTGYIEREYIQDNLGNGSVKKVYGRQWKLDADGKNPVLIEGRMGFRPDPRDEERRVAEERRKDFADRLFDAAEKAGGIERVIAALTEVGGDEPTPPKRKAAA
jgi:hypothetical protein